MNSEPSPDRFSGSWYVIRKSDGYKLESYYGEENAIEAANYLTKVEPNNNYYVEQVRRLDR